MFQEGLRNELSSFEVAPRKALEDHLPRKLLLATVPTIRSESATGHTLRGEDAGIGGTAGGPHSDDTVVATNHHVLVQAVASRVPHPCIRRRFHLEDVHGKESNVYVLSRMVALREQLARTVGFASYADMMCSDRMSGS